MARSLTRAYLLSVPLENDYKHTLYFTDRNSQYEYFINKQKHFFTEISYQRKDGFIRVPRGYDDLQVCNYLMYQNPDPPETSDGYVQRWYYAFITKLEYVNDNTTNVYFETDVIQTWLFDYQIKSSFVEREHVNDDTIGLHTVPEQLETGEYIANGYNSNESLLVTSLIIGTTVNLNSEDLSNVSGTQYNGVFSGVKYYKVDYTQAKEIVKHLADNGKADAILCIFTCPSLFISSTVPSGGTYSEVDAGMLVDYGGWINTFGIDEEAITKPSTVNGYTPKNNKLFTYPYCYLLMSNNAGASAVYKYELFENDPDFRIYSALTPGMSIRIVPLNYNGASKNNAEGLNLGKFPVCSWNTDVYTNWLTQNAVNIGASIGSSLLTVAGGATMMATGAGALAGAGAVASGVLGVASSVGEVYAHSLQPPQMEGNLNSGDVTFSAGYLTFTAYYMSIKKEYARIIDEYFNMYGYKVNRVKVPLKNHRANYWYTKTIDINIDGPIPMNDMQKIKNAYNKGITFWKNPANIQNYSVSNGIV